MKETMDTPTAQTSTNHMIIVPVSMITSRATGAADPVASPGSGHWERDSWEREQGKGSWESYWYRNNVVSLQINTAGIMAMNRVDWIVLDPIRTYACTRTACTGVRVTKIKWDIF